MIILERNETILKSKSYLTLFETILKEMEGTRRKWNEMEGNGKYCNHRERFVKEINGIELENSKLKQLAAGETESEKLLNIK